jgi:hypothetical protein
MKTCTFRGAQPITDQQGLFCEEDVSDVRYGFHPCGQSTCIGCHAIDVHECHSSSPMVNFAACSMHRFLNGYTTILNCPAVRRRTCFRTRSFFLLSSIDPVELYDNEYHLLNDVSMCRVRLCRFHRTDARRSHGVSVPIFIPFMMDISSFIFSLTRSPRTGSSRPT